jgi:hypothetical protein
VSDLMLRDLIEIPDTVHKSDFVVSLQDGIDEPEEIVGRYVVTEQLLDCFEHALGLIDAAVKGGSSKGAYLHGSFGSGKSHFMAILTLLLRGDANVRARPEFAPLLEKYDARLQNSNFLLVPYHLVGKGSMEAAVLGGYVTHVRRLHPDAPVPAVYLDGPLVEQARTLREQMGDERFFQNLGTEEDFGFGEQAPGWDAERFEAAVEAPPGDAERAALVSDFIDAYARHTTSLAEGTGGGYVPFDQGLDAVSRHAKELGYDALLLFLDELVLWFASRMADPGFVSREGPKVAKLVEAAASARPAPIVSFIARQRDLREFVGAGVTGAGQQNFGDLLEFWESRFDTIELSDTNLRAIVQQRLLRPKGEDAKVELDRAFEGTFSRERRAMDTLMTPEADRDAFRRVYPFSPALIESLIAVSSYLQRERTALRLLMQLLVERRDELRVGDLVPVGDLYDVIKGAEEPFSSDLKRHFVRTRDLYEHRIRPLLLREHGLTDEETRTLRPEHGFRTDARLVKTLLLAALVSDVGPLRNLTVRRLAYLNHGTIKTPVPGQEQAAVLQRLRRWKPDIPELRLDGDEQDPNVALKIAGVDVKGILEQAARVDNAGARRAKVRQLVSRALGLEANGGLFAHPYRWVWRGGRRQVDVQFANVRDEADLPTSGFRAGERPKMIIDFPFDEGFGPADDTARIDEVRAELDPTPTIAWLPQFLTDQALERLGRLVVLDHVLTGDRLDGYTRHLSPQDRVEARHQLESLRESHRDEVLDFLRQCYGLQTPEERWVRTGLALHEQFPSLDPTLTLKAPTAGTFKDAFEQLLDQVMRHRYPAHPEFEGEIALGDLRTALQHVERAVDDQNRRVEIPRSDRRAVRRVLQPLKLAVTGEAHIQLDRHWPDHFHRKHQENPGPVTVERLKGWVDEPIPMGLDDRVANLVICAYALMDDRVLAVGDRRVDLAVDRLDSEAELRTQKLPSEAHWEAARPRAQAIFGFDPSPIRNAANVSAVVARLQEVAREHSDAARRLVQGLERVPAPFTPSTEADRLRTAKAALRLLDDLQAADDVEAIRVLAESEVPTSGQAMGRSIHSSEAVADVLRRANWGLFAQAAGLGGEWHGRASALERRVQEGLAADELASALGSTLGAEERGATNLLGEAAKLREPEPKPPSNGTVRTAATIDEAAQYLKELEDSDRAVREIELRVRFEDE